jgi:hypothetical protein
VVIASNGAGSALAVCLIPESLAAVGQLRSRVAEAAVRIFSRQRSEVVVELVLMWLLDVCLLVLDAPVEGVVDGEGQ